MFLEDELLLALEKEQNVLKINNKKLMSEIENELYENVKLNLTTGNYKKISIICVGTDRVLWDSVGPFVGEFIFKKMKDYKNVEVLGTLSNTINATNINCIRLDNDTFGICVDSCIVMDLKKLNKIMYDNRPLTPGSGVNRKLNKIGNVSILAGTKSKHLYDYDSKPYSIYFLARKIANILNNVMLKLHNDGFI